MIDNSLWVGLIDFHELLIEKKSNTESDYQTLFEKHPSLLASLGLVSPQSFEKRSRNKLPRDDEQDYRPEPDFICRSDKSNNIVILELKTPFVGKITTQRNDGNRAKFSALAETYLSQCSEYAESIIGNHETRKYLTKLFKINEISQVRIILLYAMSDKNDMTLIESLCSKRTPQIEIMPYDILFDKLCNLYSKGASIPHDRPGFTGVYHMAIDKHQVHETSVLCETNGFHGDKVIAKYSSGVISFSLIPLNGPETMLQGYITPGEHSYVKVELASTESGAYISLMINETVTARSVSQISTPSDLSNSTLVFGADQTGKKGICCRLYEHYASDRVWKINDSLGSYQYYKRKKIKPGCVIFSGSQFLYTGLNNSLVQDEPAFRPKYYNPDRK